MVNWLLHYNKFVDTPLKFINVKVFGNLKFIKHEKNNQNIKGSCTYWTL
jgi:hypothetical protein